MTGRIRLHGTVKFYLSGHGFFLVRR